MRAIHPDPRRLLAAVGAAFVLTIAALTLPPAAGDLDLRLSGGAKAVPAAARPPVAAQPVTSPPRWVVEPLRPPAFALR